MKSKSGYDSNGKHHSDIKKFLKAQEKSQKAAKELRDYIKKLEAKYGQNFKTKDLPKLQADKLDKLFTIAQITAFETFEY